MQNKQNLPWGSLTGIRPTKLARKLLDSGQDENQVINSLVNEYFVSPQKANLTLGIIKNQNGFFERDEKFVNLYIHIPFCPTRCNYCSFVSTSIDKHKKFVDPYINKLCVEIKHTIDLIAKNNQQIYSVYIGGGTPTVLNEEQLQQILHIVWKAICRPQIEFTLEAGRPDTITAQKLKLLKTYGVNRISINSQSLNQSTLNQIGRRHTVDDFYNAYNLIMSHNFIINTDIIAGLGSEMPADFKNTLDQTIKLKPHNITVHTLAKKRGSIIKEKSIQSAVQGACDMIDYACGALNTAGYIPYYLYRQKQMLDNLENIGFCLPSYQCKNNITTMEEFLTVYACGAGAISKRIFNLENRIERLANIKDINLYLNRFSEILDRKQRFFN